MDDMLASSFIHYMDISNHFHQEYHYAQFMNRKEWEH